MTIFILLLALYIEELKGISTRLLAWHWAIFEKSSLKWLQYGDFYIKNINVCIHKTKNKIDFSNILQLH